MEWVAIAGIALSLFSGIMGSNASNRQAQAQMDQAYMNNMLRELEADGIKEAAQSQADGIRAQARRLRGSQKAQQAASGVVVGAGSAQIALDDTTALSEADALVMTYNAINGITSANAAGRFAMLAGRNQAGALQTQGYASLLSGAAGAANSYSQYKSLTTPKTT